MPNQLDIPLPALPGIEKGWELLMVDENKKSGLFTADRISRDEGRLGVVIRALTEGMSIRSIAASQGCSVNTVLAVKRRYGPEIETLKQELGRDAIDVARLAMERMRDEMQDMPKASLPIIVGVMVDKAQLLTGAPTMRIQHDHQVTVADVADYIASLPSAQPVREGDGAPQKGVAIDGADGVIEVLQLPTGVVDQVLLEQVDTAARDSQSHAQSGSPEETPAKWADFGQIEPGKGGAK